jgi:flagellar biosynthesis protein FlhF
MEGTLRTFRGPDTRTALAAVKAALGPDAIIVSTRDIGGGLMRRSEVEVTAGLAEREPRRAARAGAHAAAGRPAFLANQAAGAPAGASMESCVVEETRVVLRAALQGPLAAAGRRGDLGAARRAA